MKFTKLFSIVLFIFCIISFNIFAEEKKQNIIDAPGIISPWIGINVNNYMKDIIKNETNDGVIIKEIINNLDLKEGDIIKKVNDVEILTIKDFNKIISTQKIGDKIKLSIVRNHEKQEISVALEDIWKKTEDVLVDLGIIIKPISKDNLWGLLVVDVIKNSKAEKYGIDKHDIILGINRNFFKDLKEFCEIVSHVDLKKEVYLLVMRKDDQNNFITVTKQIGEKKEIQKSAKSTKSEHDFDE
ncbi:PDZ domain-containing protein [Candidatus Poribacteria bacterium]|nr:PDZ domain-containing protein [Candidatus Poribacteria bacterium]